MNSMTQQVLDIIRKYIKDEKISMSEYAKRAHVSKAWLSKLNHSNANLSIELANRLLDVAGYRLIIKDNFSKKESRLKQNNMVIVCQNIQ